MTSRLTGIDALRGMAALWVLFYHALGPYIVREGDSALAHVLASPLTLGFTGVNLFLVLSGFCIHLPMAMRGARQNELPRLEHGRYWKRRFWRLYPAYAAAMVFSLLFGVTSWLWIHNDYSMAAAFGRLHDLRWDIASHVTLTHIFSVHTAWGMSNGAFWSLALEAQLYVLYPLLLVMRRRMSLLRVLGWVLLVTLAWRAYGTWVWSTGDWGDIMPRRVEMFVRLHAPARWLEWTLGFAAAEVYARGLTLPAWCRSWSLGLGLFVIGALTERSDIGRWLIDPLWGVSFFMLLTCVIHREQTTQRAAGRVWATLAAAGVFSYSLYLIHSPILRAAQLLMYNYSVPRWWAIGVYLVTAFGCIGMGRMFFHYFERPFLHQRKESPAVAGSLYTTGQPPHPLPLSERKAA